jgi:eukaryotic-like serine/threonine-protein kinase
MQEKIGHYTIVSQLGRGGMGVVYKAHEEALNRFVAIKVLTEGLTEDATFLQRFVREAQAAAGLSHPNIVQIFFIGEDGGHPYFVMEYVTGRSLNHVLREEGRIGNPRASQMILQAAHGLAAAHDKGIIHRDIKPANLILDDRGLVKIADFGLALPVDAENRLTATGMMVGTPGYLAPEQCRGEKVDHRTDIYALGITYYQLLTGQAPDVTTLNPDVDPESRRILQKMIAKDREQRYQDCHQLVADLEEYLATRGVRSMTAGLAVPKPATAAAPAAMAAATQVLNSRLTNPQADVPTTIDTPAPATAAVNRLAAKEPNTMPDQTYQSPATAPSMAIPPAVAYVPPPAAPKKSSAWVVIALALVLVLGGGAAAAIVGVKMYNNWKNAKSLVATTDTTTTATSSAAVVPQTSSASTQPDPRLLFQPQQVPTKTDAAQVPVSDSTAAPVGGQAASPVYVPPVAQPTHIAQNNPHPSGSGAVVTRPPEQPRPARRASGVAIAVMGDANLVSSVSQVVNSELSAAGLKTVETESLPATEGVTSTSRLISRLRDAGYAVLVVARVDAAGERQLKYLGRYDTAYTSKVTLTTYDLATGNPFGSPARGTIEYTTANADRKAEEVVGRLARDTAEAIQNH